eukprot:TRINITY_DN252_c0_g1_i2.p1 TRINITY_DN252_c0_g1~~TRINITY_DN252_c0_g1_i2.p1  ORF type:complete len:538 (+),score=80.97 TRINITY_DN252_c0_g1_i2:36-1616(+)
MQGYEVATRDRPPYIEDVAVEGPTRSPVMDAITTFDEQRKIEADYEWFRYSKFALPFLFFNLCVAVVLFCLTVWYGNTTLKHITPGFPKSYEFPSKGDKNEAGIPKYDRNTRIAAILVGFTGLLGLGLTMYSRPPLAARKGLYFIFAFLLFAGGVIAGVAFGLDSGNVDNAVRCRLREQGNVVVPEPCKSYATMAYGMAYFDIACCVFGIFTALVFFYAAAKATKSVEESQWQTDELQVTQRGVSAGTRHFLLVLFLLTFAWWVIFTVFTIMLHEARDKQYTDEVYNVRRFSNTESGWPVKNTRLRLSVTGLVIITILLNFIPFRSRVIAYIFAFIYFLGSWLAFVVFALDVKEVATARGLGCPDGWDCKYHPYNATIFFDIFLGFVLVVYVLAEFIARLFNECTHCARGFGLFQTAKHETVCAARPVQCEICMKRLSAREFVYQHRFSCGVESSRCDACGLFVAGWERKAHAEECSQQLVPCSMCGETIARVAMSHHTASCPEQNVSCGKCNEAMPRFKLNLHQC